jgi:hypothetical protein
MERQMTALFKQFSDVKVFSAVMVHRNDLARVLYQLCFREGWSGVTVCHICDSHR